MLYYLLKNLYMDKNYYDILQINRNASPEIIEKAYKTLAKKYHPDLQLEQARQKAYHDAYIQDLKNRGYKTCYKKTLKDYIKSSIPFYLLC